MAQKDSEALIERVEVAEEDVADMAEAPESRHITRELTEVSQRTGNRHHHRRGRGPAGNGRHTRWRACRAESWTCRSWKTYGG